MTNTLAATVVALLFMIAAPLAQLWSSSVGSYGVQVVRNAQSGLVPDPLQLRIQRPGQASPDIINLKQGRAVTVSSYDSQRVSVIVDADLAVVANLATGAEVDRFLTSRAAVSPNGRWIAFARRESSMIDKSDIYLVFDVNASSSANRMTAPSSDDFIRLQDAGNAVFPNYAFSGRTYRDPPDGVDVEKHHQRSPLVWIDNNRFVFLDYKRGAQASQDELSAVYVGLQSGALSPDIRVQSLSADEIVNSAALPQGFTGRTASLPTALSVTAIDSTATTAHVKFSLEGESFMSATSIEVYF